MDWRPASNTPDAAEAGLLTMSSRRAIIGPIVANIAFVIELTLVPLLLPMIQTQFALSISELAWVFNSYAIAVAVGVLLGGWFGDVFNTKKVFRAGVALFAFGSVLLAFAGNFETLIVGRMLQGFGGGVFSPLVPLLLTRAVPQRPGRILIVWGSVSGYVAAFAPLLYGALFEGYGWNPAFILTAFVAILAAFIMNGSRAESDIAASAGPTMEFWRLLRSPDLWLMFVYVFCTYGSVTFYLFWVPVWLASAELQTAAIGFTLSIMWLSFSGLSTLLRNWVDAPNVQTIMLAAPILVAVGFALSYYCTYPACLLLSAILVGSGLACSNAPSTQLILRFAPKGMSAFSAGLDITFARLGGIATVTVLAEKSFAIALPTILLFCLVAAFCASTIVRWLAEGT